ncbi:DnaA regulatory inactivator HdaA [Rhizobium sp. L1K21]|uniref:DnaA regulatory inactivator HdaA n=1 Tax=Rhizobium sp. L1K21 TaxID=2954933 RepID=UPI002092BCE8|nr:DnaA regulatory inactivator HdaA [Rhizobium sp. L1K21]MCO6186480.1 DnaA regulatory inactivator HdaA [Rhizobium sp. L1K21]
MTADRKDLKSGSEQLPLAFGHEARASRDDLLVGRPLEAAVSMIDRWPDWPSPVVVLAGPPGSGKSHLANIWREETGAQVIAPTSGGAASETAAHHPVLFEDADRIAFDDNALFHTINAVRQNGTTLLMTARSWPSLWPVELPDLKSRLKAATMVEIGEPDDALLAQVLVKLFADRQLFADDRLVSYIATRMERSMAAAAQIVDRLDRLALARATKINRNLAAEVLAEIEAGSSS